MYTINHKPVCPTDSQTIFCQQIKCQKNYITDGIDLSTKKQEFITCAPQDASCTFF